MPANRRGNLATREAEGAHRRQVSSATAHRRDQGVSQGSYAEEHNDGRDQAQLRRESVEVADVVVVAPFACPETQVLTGNSDTNA